MEAKAELELAHGRELGLVRSKAGEGAEDFDEMYARHGFHVAQCIGLAVPGG